MPKRTRSHVDFQKLRRDLGVPPKGTQLETATALPADRLREPDATKSPLDVSAGREPSGAHWEQIDEIISVGRPVGSVLPVAFWWRHTFYRIDSVLSRRFGCGRKELTVSTASGLFRLADQGRRWTLVACCTDPLEISSAHGLTDDINVR